MTLNIKSKFNKQTNFIFIMASCELCGESVNSLNNVNVSGSILKVCNSCKSMGKETMGTSSKSYTFKKTIRDKLGKEEVVSNYSSLIQSSLSKKNYTIHQLARGTNIKESNLNNYMKKTVKLDVETAKRIGKFLGISLVYEVSDEEDSSANDYIKEDESNSAGLSLGDLIQQKLNEKQK